MRGATLRRLNTPTSSRHGIERTQCTSHQARQTLDVVEQEGQTESERTKLRVSLKGEGPWCCDTMGDGGSFRLAGRESAGPGALTGPVRR